MSRPIAVCISDLHFNLITLPLASKALRAALAKAEALNVTLIIAGDLHDTKAIIRGEVANELLDILKDTHIDVLILSGNHDLLNEKAPEHGLNYLSSVATIIDCHASRAIQVGRNYVHLNLIPYGPQDTVKRALEKCGKGSIIIMHQGFLGAAMGDYVQDKTSIDPELVKDFKVISGHYHRHQTIGTVTYIGSPFTMSFGEANDGPKGFLILNSDGSFTREILQLRKHVVINGSVTDGSILNFENKGINEDDLVWIKLTGPKSILNQINKNHFDTPVKSNFKLDLIPIDDKPLDQKQESFTDIQILDNLINASEDTDKQKAYLKELYRALATS